VKGNEIEELTGGTFTISNGGVYGSLLSTPILNPPQAEFSVCTKLCRDRPRSTARWKWRPMMYLALSYDITRAIAGIGADDRS